MNKIRPKKPKLSIEVWGVAKIFLENDARQEMVPNWFKRFFINMHFGYKMPQTIFQM